MIEIWQPRWRDRSVLIAKHKVKGRSSEIKFTKSPSIGDAVYQVDNSVIRNCPLESNGKIDCYVVPLSSVLGEIVERNNHETNR